MTDSAETPLWAHVFTPRPEAVLFDFDGTLVDTRTVSRQAVDATFAAFGLDTAEPQPPDGTAFLDRVERLAATGRLPRSLDAALLRERCEREIIDRAREAEVVEPVVEVARQARGLLPRLPTAVVTGSTLRVVTALLTIKRIDDLFDHVVAREDAVRGKPAPDLFLTAAERLGTAPSRCVVLEDTEIGLTAARAAGMRPVDIRPVRDGPQR